MYTFFRDNRLKRTNPKNICKTNLFDTLSSFLLFILDNLCSLLSMQIKYCRPFPFSHVTYCKTPLNLGNGERRKSVHISSAHKIAWTMHCFQFYQMLGFVS